MLSNLEVLFTRLGDSGYAYLLLEPLLLHGILFGLIFFCVGHFMEQPKCRAAALIAIGLCSLSIIPCLSLRNKAMHPRELEDGKVELRVVSPHPWPLDTSQEFGVGEPARHPLVQDRLDPPWEHLEAQHHLRTKGVEGGDGMELPAMVLGILVGFPEKHRLLPDQFGQNLTRRSGREPAGSRCCPLARGDASIRPEAGGRTRRQAARHQHNTTGNEAGQESDGTHVSRLLATATNTSDSRMPRVAAAVKRGTPSTRRCGGLTGGRRQGRTAAAA